MHVRFCCVLNGVSRSFGVNICSLLLLKYCCFISAVHRQRFFLNGYIIIKQSNNKATDSTERIIVQGIMGNGGYPFFYCQSLWLELLCSCHDIVNLSVFYQLVTEYSFIPLCCTSDSKSLWFCPTSDRSTSVISMFRHWECCLRCHEVMFTCVQMMAASSFTHNPDPLGVLQWSLCSNMVVELYAWMILRTSVEDTVGLEME